MYAQEWMAEYGMQNDMQIAAGQSVRTMLIGLDDKKWMVIKIGPITGNFNAFLLGNQRKLV